MPKTVNRKPKTAFIFSILANVWYRLDRRHRRIALRNLEFAFGPELTPAQRQSLALEAFCHLVRLFWEGVGLLLCPKAWVQNKFVMEGLKHTEAALKQGRGIIGITAHTGNWEYTVMGYGLALQPVVVVGRRHNNPLINWVIRHLRERGGNEMIDKQGGLKAIISHLKQHHVIGVLIDQNTATQEGVLVKFFGHEVRATPVAAILARRYNIPVIPVFSRRLPDGRHLLVIQPPIPFIRTEDARADIIKHVQAQTEAVESWIRRYPQQWLWLHKRWKNRYPELYEGL